MDTATAKQMGSKGGKATAEKYTPEQRSDRARVAVRKRWSATIPKATHGSPDRVLRLGDVDLQCYVLGDGRRVITQRSLMAGIGMGVGGGEKRLVDFGAGMTQKGLDCKDLTSRIQNPIKFAMPVRGVAHGYEAKTLVDFCNVILRARREGLLQAQQMHLAEQCEIVVSSLAKAGIDALVDEVTGYQLERANGELQKLLAKYVGEELSSWVLTFRPSYYKQIYRLRGWKIDPKSPRRPGAMANYTCNLVYDRLCPTVVEELKKTRAKCEGAGGPKGGKLHQYLTEIGHPKLAAHIEGVTAIARFSKSWDEFLSRMDEVYPRRGDTLPIPFPEDEDADTVAKSEGERPPADQ